jgi:soluble lytic murein transglycosylase
MPESLRNQNRWRYWAGRTAELLGQGDTARANYAAVIPTDNWYAALAAARIGQRFTPTLQPLARDDAELARVAAAPGLVRTRELILCDMQSDANQEWKAAFDALTPAQQVQAVRLASSWDWHLQAIAAAARLGLFNDYELLYPRPFDAEVRRGAELTGLPQALIYAVIRQESLFRADAASSANALGLMQLLPSTAQTTARRAGLPPPSRASLLQPSVNVPLGSSFLRYLLDRADGQWPLAIAGYNAGPGAARRWLAEGPVATDVWVENIPFNETRAYVQRVHWHSLVFEWLADRKPRDTSVWLGTVRAPSVATTTPDGG